jgi:hypothetical protein
MTSVEHLYDMLQKNSNGRARLQLATYRPTGTGGGTAEGESELVVLLDREIDDAQKLRNELGKVLRAARKFQDESERIAETAVLISDYQNSKVIKWLRKQVAASDPSATWAVASIERLLDEAGEAAARLK